MSDNPKTSLLASADTRTLGPWRVRVGFTSRAAGNLGLHVDDELGGGMDASLVRTLNHRAALEEALGTEPFFYLNQVHGVQIAYPEDYEVESYAPGAPQERTVERARAVLEEAGVRVSMDCAQCTFEEPEVYSHRGFTNRGEKPGRIAGLVWIEKAAEPAA